MTKLLNKIGKEPPQEASGEQRRARDSPVKQMFEGRSVFITGASGFIGRVLLEKLLRCYPNIKNIYILMREKKNQNPHTRLHEKLLKVPLFDRLRSMENGQQLLDKIVVIPGDIAHPWLGISESDRDRLFKDPSLSVVFHLAATVRFDEPLKVAVRMNLMATKTVIDLCRRLPNLISLCHVSTAYTNSDILDEQSYIKEEMYPISEEPKDLMQLTELLKADHIQILEKHLVNRRPNTYTYTKALAEKLIGEEAADLPIVIVRPSIVIASWMEPIPGWVDNLYGPTGLLLATGKGLMRTLYVSKEGKADLVPVDVVVNAMVASAYYAARAYDKFHPDRASPSTGDNFIANNNISSAINHNGSRKDFDSAISKAATMGSDPKISEALAIPKPPIFHVNSGDLNPLTWGQIEGLSMPLVRKYPSLEVFRYPGGTMKSNEWVDLITRIFVHYLPALFFDTICSVMGKKRQVLSLYSKLHHAIATLAYFTTHNYNFRTDNLSKLQAILEDEDREVLFMDIERLSWSDYWKNYWLGCRRYILRESDGSLEQARLSSKRSRIFELTFWTVFFLLMVTLPLISFRYVSEAFGEQVFNQTAIPDQICRKYPSLSLMEEL